MHGFTVPVRGVVYYGYLYNKEDNTGDKFDTNLDGLEMEYGIRNFSGLVDCIDKPVNVPDEFRGNFEGLL